MEKQLIDIYALKHPVTGEVRYIGKANNAQARLKMHLRENRRVTPLYNWIRKLAREGMQPRMEVIAQCLPDEWQEAERKAIADARSAGVRLLNVAEGGDEPHCAPEVRKANGKNLADRMGAGDLLARLMWNKRILSSALRKGELSERAKATMRLAAERHPHLFGAWRAI